MPALAPLRRRLISLVYEALILAALLLAATLPIVLLTRGWDHAYSRLALQTGLLIICGGFYVAQWRGMGQTLPMKTWRMRLTLANGEPLGTSRAVLRYLAAIASLATLGAGFLWALIDKDKQFLHDRVCGTRLFQIEATPA